MMQARQSQSRVSQTQTVDPAAPSSLSRVQRPLGAFSNQAALRLARGIPVQPKLDVSQPGDRFELEADRVAESVMRIAGPIATPSIQRMCSGCDEELQRKESAPDQVDESIQISLSTPGALQRMCAGCHEESQHEDPVSAPPSAGIEISSHDVAGAVQRMCQDCEEEKAAIEGEEEDERELVSAKQTNPGRPESTAIDSSHLNTLQGSGHPLPVETRSFFEARMGHDFRSIRVHSDGPADQLARSVQARAFTHSNHLVFRAGEYQPDSTAGRYLLAHELAHTIQQGASPSARHDAATEETTIQRQVAPGGSSAPAIQRVCDVTAPPGDMDCPQATSSAGSGTPIMFGLDSFTIDPLALPTLAAIKAAWHTGGRVDVLRVDGFASCDGPPALNWRLSCNRAKAVRTELEAGTPAAPGVDPANIEIAANGETNQFSSTSLPPNRRAVITSGGIPPPGPPCALTIAGPAADPNNVDHYCAAYVPSDAVSCGVFPAPSITLTSAGAAVGATLSWRISRGATRASIVGANNGPSVVVRGDAASAAQGDVTVQLSDGTCTATHFLTVRQPSAITPAEVHTNTPASIQDSITYTVRDQFGNPMGANICVDETVTVCSDNHPELGGFRFGDAGTDAAGQVTDTLFTPLPTTAPPLCTKLDQILTAGGCGPLLHNTILFRPAGVTLNQNTNCAAGGACP